jgi:hypothetical protein
MAPAAAYVYTDSLAQGWENWSWGANVSLQDSAYRSTGSYSASCAYSQAWGGFYFGSNAAFDTTGYGSLIFYVNGGANSGQLLTINLADEGGNFLPSRDLNPYIGGGSIAANTWRQVSVPLADLGGSNRPITGIVLQDALGGAQPRFYIDDMHFMESGPGGSPTATPNRTATAPPPTPTRPPATATPVAGLPPVPPGVPPYFSYGLFNGDPNTIPAGVPWDFRYQYLAGGANTGEGWATWNNPPGQYALNFINASRERGMIPSFQYYQILQSAPHYDEYANLNDPQTMYSYFEDFKTLMQKSAQAGVGPNNPIFVNIEADLTGVMMQHPSNTQDNAALQPSSVASSGHPDVQGLPNTFRGVYQGLARIRDIYAPGLVLGIDVSSWGATDDIAILRDPNYNWRNHATRTGNYLNSLGPGFGMLFWNPLDRDAAWYLRTQGSNRWWDDNNVTLPHFNRMAEWMGLIVQVTGRRVMMWQVPNGNRVYRSVNNTDGHWQDNRPEYFLNPSTGRQHMAQWANYGFLGIMFGAGTGSQSHYFDYKNDGITNPAPINGNNEIAQYADDDGGYIRIYTGNYYAGGTIPLPQAGAQSPTAIRTNTPTTVSTSTLVPTHTSTRTPLTTNTRTSTPLPTNSATSTRTPTAVPPTRTATAIPTNTPGPGICPVPNWANLVRVVNEGGTLRKVSSNNAWNAGAVSTQSLSSGGGYAEITVDNSLTRWAFGLNRNNGGAHYNDIDYAFVVKLGTLEVYENGTLRGRYGQVRLGDRLRVVANGTTVRYLLNDSTLHTSLVSPTYPLVLDTSIHTSGGEIRGARLCTTAITP